LPRPRTAMEWFHALFAFVKDATLRKHLAESCYQARFVGRFQEALWLPGKFNRAILKQQIILYAAIYEAVIDYFLGHLKAEPAVRDLLVVVEFKEVRGVLANGVTLKGKVGTEEFDVVTCRRVRRTRKLQEVRFSDRIAVARSIGLMPRHQAEFVQDLYDARNNIHIIRAAEEQFAPDARMSSRAFRTLLIFFRHVTRWAANLPNQPTAGDCPNQRSRLMGKDVGQAAAASNAKTRF
jgi:hypothetical protein